MQQNVNHRGSSDLVEKASLTIRSGFQTKTRGTHASEYEIYVSNAVQLGWGVKSYEEWLAS